ncbi:HAD family hydrolase [Streptomyces sp. MP131-18]|uniref:HAD family hydrolase n=1 Tax=Streptomyces sp. MP131-18 TaxID=1857892 RepID=UPI00097C088D|nr:HAD family hydrolase [Streptomyces sp. MP131-18]ONK13204.1 Pyrimidine 5'-nucleotidase YjjG [Streptomyces sp. MP131-18]
MIHSGIEAVAFDYYGTLTGDARRQPDGEFVRGILQRRFDVAVQHDFARSFDVSLPRFYADPVADTIPDLLKATAARHEVNLPDMEPLITAIWTECGDHPIDPEAADAVRAVHEAGFTCVLASNMVRPETHRAKTLADAGLDFMRLVCSSTVGAGKPDPRFYREVLHQAGVDAPHKILFTGDELPRDVVGPIRAGMLAAWIDRRATPGSPPGVMVDGTLALSHLSQLLPYLGIEKAGESA